VSPGSVDSVRLAEPGDEAQVARLLGEFRDWWGKSTPTDGEFEASVERILAEGDGEYLLAFDRGGEPVGVCQLRYRWSIWTSAPDCWLEDLYVRPAGRRSGLGRRLVDAAVERARARGCRRVELDVNEDNEAALALYRACGFTLEPKGPTRTLFISRSL